MFGINIYFGKLNQCCIIEKLNKHLRKNDEFMIVKFHFVPFFFFYF